MSNEQRMISHSSESYKVLDQETGNFCLLKSSSLCQDVPLNLVISTEGTLPPKGLHVKGLLFS